MYKTSAEVQTTRKDLIEVEMSDEKDNVCVYVRNGVDCRVIGDAGINMSPESFIDLVYPILKEKGYRLNPAPEGF